MYIYKYTSRPARYGAIIAHSIGEFLRDVNVDLSKVEDTLADQVAALTAKVDELQARLEAYDESVDEVTNTRAKPKAKRKQRSKASSSSGAAPRAKK